MEVTGVRQNLLRNPDWARCQDNTGRSRGLPRCILSPELLNPRTEVVQVRFRCSGKDDDLFRISAETHTGSGTHAASSG
jgi:hypothetical protein